MLQDNERIIHDGQVSERQCGRQETGFETDRIPVLSAGRAQRLGTYFGNCTSGGNNYEACVVTARNAINEYPYAKQREQLSALVVMAKYKLAEQSVESKKDERFRETIDEFYGFKNEFPESKYMKELEKIRKDSEKKVRNTSEL